MSQIDEEKRATKPSESSSEEATVEEHGQQKSKFDLPPSLKDKLKEIPEAMEYIERLQRLIKKQIKKINKWKGRIKKMQKPKDCFTQTDFDGYFVNNSEEQKMSAQTILTETDVKYENKTLADDIKEAAEMAIQNSGFVYEETSGMYYDYNTGYYYNAEYGLYYDGNTGTYLKYNQETQSYDFHSQVEVLTHHEKPKEEDKKQVVRKRKNKNCQKTKDHKRHRGENTIHSPKNDVEEGECSDSDESCSSYEEKSDTDTQ